VAIGDGVSALASLAVTFGGFSPTAMDGVQASKDQVERLEREQALKKEQRRRELELERARTSEPRNYIDCDGNTWTYVVIDDSVVRLVNCESVVKHLIIPSEIDDKPVYAIGPEACGRLDYVQEIICPDSIEIIGACAFRLCPELRRIVLPKNVSNYASSWLQHCGKLEEIVLPGKLDEITPAVLDNKSLRRLCIGPEVHSVEPGSFQDGHLEEILVDPANPFVMAIWSIHAGTSCVKISIPQSRNACFTRSLPYLV